MFSFIYFDYAGNYDDLYPVKESLTCINVDFNINYDFQNFALPVFGFA
jgi:hypothetical protein